MGGWASRSQFCSTPTSVRRDAPALVPPFSRAPPQWLRVDQVPILARAERAFGKELQVRVQVLHAKLVLLQSWHFTLVASDGS